MKADPYLRYSMWRPLMPLARIVVALLAITGLVSVVSLIGLLRVSAASDVTAPISELNGSMQEVFGSTSPEIQSLSLLLSIATTVMWLIWQHRAQSALYARRIPRLRYTPGWCVGWWFVPFANLVVPYLCLRELFGHAGEPALEGAVRSDARVWGWWAAYLGSMALGLVGAAPIFAAVVRAFDAASLESDDEPVVTITADAIRTARSWAIASRVASIAAVVLALWLVWTISRREDALEGSVAPAGAALAVPPRPDLW